jgi:REP element-mobilizing transposase RayT
MHIRKSFGGESIKGKRKSSRPLCTKRTIHLVLRSKQPKLKRNEHAVRVQISRAAKRWGIRIYRLAIVNDHVHLLIRIPTRMAYRFFIQRITGAVALKLGIEWMFRPFTRIVEWGRDFKRAKNEYQPRGRGALKRRPWFSGATA